MLFVFSPNKASAATIDVAMGSASSTNSDSICQLEEAMANINDGAQTYADCVEVGAYGTNDTVNLPVGTITGADNYGSGFYVGLNNKSISVIGQGKDSTTIEGVNFNLSGSGIIASSALFKDFKMTVSIATDGNYDLTVEGMEFDTDNGGGAPIAIYTGGGDLTIKDSYFHNEDMDFNLYSGSSMESFVKVNYGEDINVIIENSTFKGGNEGVDIFAGSGFTANALIKNSTFTGMRGVDGFVPAGIRVVAYDGTINYTTINNTFSDMRYDGFNGSGLSAAAIQESIVYEDSSTIHHTAQNDLYAVGNGNDNEAVNYDRFNGSGIGTFITTSLGGNISSDNSFSTRLTQASDKHSQTTLASFLGVLADNGGSVPTLALTDGSPAINAGTNVAGMTTDARGAARPQGGFFDAGAYELAFAEEPGSGNNGGGNSGNSGSSNTTTTTNPSLKSPASSASQFSLRPITITTPAGTNISSSNTVTEAFLGTQDPGYQYPLGLVNFSFATTQTDNQVTLTFVTDLKPNQVKPRKYNSDTKTYTDIKDYTLTETTVNGQHALVLTYTITDNGDLDLDKTTGVINDPVGLAVTNDTYSRLANTGQNTILATVIAGAMITASTAMLLTTKLKKKVRYLFR